MKKKGIKSLKINNIENLTPKTITDKKEIERLKSIALVEVGIDDLKKYFIDIDLFEIYYQSFLDLINKCIPIEVRRKCNYCKGESENEKNHICEKYALQMEITFFYGVKHFDDVLKRNSHIIKDPSIKQELATLFFKCIYGNHQKGLLYFDSIKLMKYCLSLGFLSISKQFKEIGDLNSLKAINYSLDHIETFELTKNVRNEGKIPFPKKQKKFLKKKRKHIKEKLKIKEITDLSIQPNKPKKDPTINQIALFYFYLQQGKNSPYFENHPKGKLVAINELIKEKNIRTTQKYFQKKYNEINNYKQNRIGSNQVKNLQIVLNLLDEYPNSYKIAEKELQMALSNSK